MSKLRLQHASLSIAPEGHERARAFYGGLIGLTEKPLPESLVPLKVIWFEAGDNETELHLVPDPISPNSEEGRHICFEVEHLENLRHTLEDAGYRTFDAEPIPHRPRFFCFDPFGNRLEFTSILGDYRKP